MFERYLKDEMQMKALAIDGERKPSIKRTKETMSAEFKDVHTWVRGV